MSVTYEDLTNSNYPDIESDERYLFRDMAIDDIPYIKQYQKLVNALNAAAENASDVSSYQEEWDALDLFKKTDEYKNHVEPLNMTAKKFQTLEDMTISAQRFAKRQKQQWIISETQPERNEQAVDDVWFRIDEITDSGLVNATPFYKGEDGNYHEFAVASKTSFSSNEDIDNIITGKDVTNPNAVINNEALKRYVNAHDEEFDTYKDGLDAALAAIKADIATNANNITKNKTDIATNKSNIATNKSNIDKNKSTISTMQATINAMNTEIKTLQSVINTVSTSKTGTDIVTSISGGETISDRVVYYGQTFNNKPVVGASTDRGEVTVKVTRIENGFFEYEITNNSTPGTYEAQVRVNWVATAKLT